MKTIKHKTKCKTDSSLNRDFINISCLLPDRFHKTGKKMILYFMSVGLCASLVGCQSDFTGLETPESETVSVQFLVSAPDELVTRTTGNKNSRMSGLANVDFEKYDLRYQLAVYRIDGDRLIEAITPQAQTVDTYRPVTYSLQLTPDRQYKVAVWADFVKQGETGDLHYDTSDFRDIEVIDTIVNDESKDAFCISHEFTAGETVAPLKLKRPFAKLRIVTTDWIPSGPEMPDNFRITYFGCRHFRHFDAVTGISSGEMLPENGNITYTGYIDREQKEYTEDYDASENNRTLIVDYLLTDQEQPTALKFTFDAFCGETPVTSRRFETGIPVQRNWLTTIIGNILTQGKNDITASIERKLDNN